MPYYKIAVGRKVYDNEFKECTVVEVKEDGTVFAKYKNGKLVCGNESTFLRTKLWE